MRGMPHRPGFAPKYSLGSWAFSFGPFALAPWSFERVCRYATDAGYDGIEINGFRPHPHQDDFATAGRVSELRAMLADRGLGISGFAPDLSAVPPALASAADYLRQIENCLRFCDALGIRKLRVDTGSPPTALPTEDYARRFEHLVSTWRQAAYRCALSGVDLVWEFEPGFWLNKPGEICGLVDAVGHPRLKTLFDTCHAHMCAVVGARQVGDRDILPGGVAELAQRLAGRIGHIHFIDSDGSLHDNETSAHVPFGDGTIDFGAVLAVLRDDLAKLPWWCIDFCFCPTTERDARKAVSYLRRLVARVP